MKTAIVYCSQHHGNTKKLLDAIAAQGDVTLIDAAAVQSADLAPYELVGLASGIYYQKYHQSVMKFAQQNLPRDKKVFLVYTYGVKRPGYANAIAETIRGKGGDLLGEYGCLGFDTFGPFKLIGGIAKGRPNEGDVAGAVSFFNDLVQGAQK